MVANARGSFPMPVFSDAPAALYTQAWIGLLFIFGVIVLAGVALRWRPHRPTEVTRYEPPKEISPAIAAFLIEGGRCERSFAAAIISLGTKGYIKIAAANDRSHRPPSIKTAAIAGEI